MDGYEVTLYYRPNDGCSVAQIVEFVGCAVDGPTPEDALFRLREAKAEWIRIVQENGYQVPPPRYSQSRVKAEASELTAA
jgi:predicted RNase H-like HicB family nuclease